MCSLEIQLTPFTKMNLHNACTIFFLFCSLTVVHSVNMCCPRHWFIRGFRLAVNTTDQSLILIVVHRGMHVDNNGDKIIQVFLWFCTFAVVYCVVYTSRRWWRFRIMLMRLLLLCEWPI